MQQPVTQIFTSLEQLRERAIEHAVAGNWARAVEVNQELLAIRPSDVGALNRLGNALLEMGDSKEAARSYQAALAADPHNRIAARNLARLQDEGTAPNPRTRSTPSAAMERAMGTARGTSLVTMLVRCGPVEVLRAVPEGERLKIAPSPGGIRVSTPSGDYLGTIAPRLSARLARLIVGGNRYAVTAASVVNDALAVHIQETHRSPEQAHIASFPPRLAASEARDVDLDRFDVSGDEGGHVEMGLDELETESDDEVADAVDPRKGAVMGGRVLPDTAEDPVYDALR